MVRVYNYMMLERHSSVTEDPVVRVQRGEVQRAVEAIQRNGFVIVEQVVPAHLLDRLRRRMDEDTIELLDYCASIGGNPREGGHLQQGPPPLKEFVFPEVAMNAHVLAICRALFKQRPRLDFYNGNTNAPGRVRQHLHMDGAHRNSSPDPVEATFSVVLNVPPGPMDLSNGAIELWPGSHMVRSEQNNRGIDEDQMNRRQREAPPIQPTTRVGDVLIRDMRLWHRGVPNTSTRPRHMIALIFSDAQDESRYRLPFEKGCEQALEGHDADANARYTDEHIDYLLGPTKGIYEARQRARQNQK